MTGGIVLGLCLLALATVVIRGIRGRKPDVRHTEDPVEPVSDPVVIEAIVRGFMETGFCVYRVVFNDGSEYRRLKDTFASYPDGRLLSHGEVSSVRLAAIEFHVRRCWAEEKKQNEEMGIGGSQ